MSATPKRISKEQVTSSGNPTEKDMYSHWLNLQIVAMYIPTCAYRPKGAGAAIMRAPPARACVYMRIAHLSTGAWFLCMHESGIPPPQVAFYTIPFYTSWCSMKTASHTTANSFHLPALSSLQIREYSFLLTSQQTSQVVNVTFNSTTMQDTLHDNCRQKHKLRRTLC